VLYDIFIYLSLHDSAMEAQQFSIHAENNLRCIIDERNAFHGFVL
jgi:hypothetical protein